MLWFDIGGHFHAGPKSAGAVPGPVCYDLGQEDPTVTDANLVLGYLNPEYLAGGSVKLNATKAYKSIEDKIAKRLNSGILEAAYGGHIIANSSMIRAIRAVSTERGRDPRDFVLFAYGGAGPMHAAELARELGIKKIIVPPAPGLFSSLGLLFAEIEHHHIQAFFHRLDGSVVDGANQVWQGLKEKALDEIEVAGYGDVKVTFQKYVDARYIGQTSELTIPAPWEQLNPKNIAALSQKFHDEHLKSFAHKRVDEPIDLVNLRLVATIPPPAELVPQDLLSAGIQYQARGGIRTKSRKAYFGKELGLRDAAILGIDELVDKPRKGPAIVELYDSTCVVPPGYTVTAGSFGTISIDVES